MVLICCCCCLLYPGCVLDWTYVSGQSGNASSGNLDHQKRPQRAEVHGASLPYLCLFAHATLLHVVLLSYLFHRSCKGQKVHVKNWLTEGSVKSQLLGHSSWMFGGCHNFVMTLLVNSIVLVWAMCVCWWQCQFNRVSLSNVCVLVAMSWATSWCLVVPCFVLEHFLKPSRMVTTWFFHELSKHVNPIHRLHLGNIQGWYTFDFTFRTSYCVPAIVWRATTVCVCGKDWFIVSYSNKHAFSYDPHPRKLFICTRITLGLP